MWKSFLKVGSGLLAGLGLGSLVGGSSASSGGLDLTTILLIVALVVACIFLFRKTGNDNNSNEGE